MAELHAGGGSAQIVRAPGTAGAVQGQQASGSALAGANLAAALPFNALQQVGDGEAQLAQTTALSVAVGGTAQREVAGGAAVTAGGVTLTVGGARERERAGGVVASSVSIVAVGGVREIDAPGGLVAQPGVVTLTVGGAREVDRPGGLVVQPGAVTVAPGGYAERDGIGGIVVAPGVVSLAVGGVREIERAGGFAASSGDFLTIGGTRTAERPGGVAAYVASEYVGRRLDIAATDRDFIVTSTARELSIQRSDRVYTAPASNRGNG